MKFYFILYECFLLFVSTNASNSQALVPFTYHGAEHKKTFLAANRVFEFSKLTNQRIKITQKYKANGAGLGSAVWDGSFVLAEYMQRKVDVKDKCVVEIGCGLGLVSIVLSLRNAFVIATDGDENLFPILKENFKDNIGISNVNKKTSINLLRWGNRTQMDNVINKCPNGIDLIVAADVVFEHDPLKKNVKNNLHSANVTFPLLYNTLKYLSSHNKKKRPEIYLAYKQRYSREGSFFSLMQDSFDVTHISRRDIHRDFIKAKIKIFKFLLKKEVQITNTTTRKAKDEL